jgi:septal ring factor EnvC (AmiA/AmiB activator)
MSNDQLREFEAWFRDLFCRACNVRRIPFNPKAATDAARYETLLTEAMKRPIFDTTDRAAAEASLLTDEWAQNKRAAGIELSDFYPKKISYTKSEIAALLATARAAGETAATERHSRERNEKRQETETDRVLRQTALENLTLKNDIANLKDENAKLRREKTEQDARVERLRKYIAAKLPPHFPVQPRNAEKRTEAPI